MLYFRDLHHGKMVLGNACMKACEVTGLGMAEIGMVWVKGGGGYRGVVGQRLRILGH